MMLLQREHGGCGARNRVDRGMRRGAVAASARDLDVEFVGGRVDYARGKPDRAGGQPAVDVQHRNRIDVRIVHRARLDHRERAARAFFRRLEEQHDVAAELLALRDEHARRAQEHRGVRVVAAGVHLAGNFRTKRFAAALGQRQRIHVGAQTRNGPAPAAHDAHDACLRDAPVLDAERREFALHERGRAHFFEAEFGMTMDLPADVGRPCGDARIDQRY